MRLFRHSFSNWWLLLLVPLTVALAPSLLLALIIGGNFVGVILGPPAIWEMPRHDLTREELAGTYKETRNNVYGASAEYANSAALPERIAELELRADGSTTVTNIPQEDPRSWSESTHSLCLLSGRGTWSVTQGQVESELSVYLHDLTPVAAGAPRCAETNIGLAEVTGQHRPFGIYVPVGDPDSGTGLRFTKQP